MRGVGRGLSDHHVVMCKVKLVGAWMDLGGLKVLSWEKRVEWDGENNVGAFVGIDETGNG